MKAGDLRPSCTRAPVGWFCTRAAGHPGPCAAAKLLPAPLEDGHRAVNMSRTPCPPAIPTTDPRLATCCLAIGTDAHGHDHVCRDTKGHDGPHDWQRKETP